MKRRIGLLLLSFVAAVSAVCIPVREVRAEKVSASVKDLLGYGEKEDFSIVPANGANTSVSMDESGAVVGVGKTMQNTDQLWHIRKSGDYYYFESKKNKKVIELPDDAKANETVLTTASFNGGDSQLWSLEREADGSFVISSKKNPELWIDAALALGNDAPGLTLSDGSWEIAERRFCFVPVSTREPVTEWGADIAAGSGKDFSEWTGCADYDWYYADKKASSYELTTADQLAGLAKLVNGGICDFSGRTISLGRDIDLQNLEWKPIGASLPEFRGIFNGNGHTIKGLCITSHNNNSGLFGYVVCGAVTDLAVSGSVTGGQNTGGVVGCMYAGHITNVSSDVKVERSFGGTAGGICGRLEKRRP